MKKIITLVFSLCALLVITSDAGAIENLVKSVAKGCEKELTTYCSNVTPGEGRVLACLYAHNDKISGKCDYALYDAAVQLERAIATLTYVASECRNDIEKYCGSVRAGKGRIAECLLDKNIDKVTERCKGAIEDVDLKYEKKPTKGAKNEKNKARGKPPA